MKQNQLSRRERQIMDILYEHQQLTAKVVMEKMEDAPAYATVRSLLRILEEKGHVQHSKTGRQFVYEPTKAREQVQHKSLKHTLKTFFGGSLSQAVATFINDPESKLSEAELDELSDLIEKAKKQQRND
ncbi:MAG: BlaI/MecI/CopY family transcriptional regulator [Bacteroidota bacterium]